MVAQEHDIGRWQDDGGAHDEHTAMRRAMTPRAPLSLVDEVRALVDHETDTLRAELDNERGVAARWQDEAARRLGECCAISDALDQESARRAVAETVYGQALILLLWEAGEITQGQASRMLAGGDHIIARELRLGVLDTARRLLADGAAAAA